MEIAPTVVQDDEPAVDNVYTKVSWRLIPVLLLCYFAAYVDRINIGFAQASMSSDLKFSTAIFGLGGGIFFIGYLLFEVPSNLLMEKIGARKTLSRILILWGAISSAMMFVHTPESFYALRFLLGVAEAGFFPGVILYLTYWFPAQRRAKIVALFMTPVAFSGLLGGPLSGWILQNFDGVNGWAAWQWMFLIEGLPSILLGVAVMLILDDRPSDARWLSTRERQVLERALVDDHPAGRHGDWRSLLVLLKNARIYVLTLIYFALVAGVITISFWIPAIIKSVFVGGTHVQIGWLTAIPYACGGIGMVLMGRHSDQTAERRWHCMASLLAGAIGIAALGAASHSLPIALVAMSLAAIGIFSGFATFWAAATQYLSATTLAAGLALVSSLGQLGGFVSPILIGSLKASTGSFAAGLYGIGAILLIGALGMFCLPAPRDEATLARVS
ncbi:MFS transporter [Paraburkholderia fungorum]|uniref:MFS transporter n=1 Tax=Paraburkholderia fungorum TaxID=134537 RepID=UPI0038B6C84E